MLIVDDLVVWLPGKALRWVFMQIYDQVMLEWKDPEVIKQQLFDLQALYELHEISLEAYEAKEKELLSRLGYYEEEEEDAEETEIDFEFEYK